VRCTELEMRFYTRSYKGLESQEGKAKGHTWQRHRDEGDKLLSTHGLVGRFSYRDMGAREIHSWVEDTWYPALGYIPDVFILIKGWYCFVFKSLEDAEQIHKQVWLVKGEILMKKKWHCMFNPEKGNIRYRHI
jgi:hypothetical protein